MVGETRIERYFKGGLAEGKGTFFGVQVQQGSSGRSELLLRVFFSDGSHLALRGAIRGGSFLLSGEGGWLRGQAGAERLHGELAAGSLRATVTGEALPPYAEREVNSLRATPPSPRRSAARW